MLSAIAFVNTKTTICSAHSLGQAQYLPFYGGRCRAQASAAEQFGSEGGGLLRERGRKNQIPPRQCASRAATNTASRRCCLVRC